MHLLARVLPYLYRYTRLAGLSVVVATAPTTRPRVEDLSLDPGVMAFAGVVSLLASWVFGALPAL